MKVKSETVRDIFSRTIEQHDFQHVAEQLSDRLDSRLTELLEREYELTQSLFDSLERLQKSIRKVVGK